MIAVAVDRITALKRKLRKLAIRHFRFICSGFNTDVL